MTEPIVSSPTAKQPETARSGNTTGEGANSALEAMIRKRQMGENHVEHDTPEPVSREAALKG